MRLPPPVVGGGGVVAGGALLGQHKCLSTILYTRSKPYPKPCMLFVRAKSGFSSFLRCSLHHTRNVRISDELHVLWFRHDKQIIPHFILPKLRFFIFSTVSINLHRRHPGPGTFFSALMLEALQGLNRSFGVQICAFGFLPGPTLVM